MRLLSVRLIVSLILERVSKTPPKRNPEAGEIEEGAVSAE